MLRFQTYRVLLVVTLAAVFFSLMASNSEARRWFRDSRPRAASFATAQSDVETRVASHRAHRRPANKPLGDEPKGEPTDWVRVDRWPLPWKSNPSKPTDDVKIDGKYRNYRLTENKLAELDDVQSNLGGTDLWPEGLDAKIDKEWYVWRKGKRQATMIFFILHNKPTPGPDDLVCGPYANFAEIAEKKVLTELYLLHGCPKPR